MKAKYVKADILKGLDKATEKEKAKVKAQEDKFPELMAQYEKQWGEYLEGMKKWKKEVPAKFADIVHNFDPGRDRYEWESAMTQVRPPYMPVKPEQVQTRDERFGTGRCLQVEKIRQRIEMMLPDKNGGISLDSYDHVWTYLEDC